MASHKVNIVFTLKVPNVPNFVFIDTDKALLDSSDKVTGVKISIAELETEDLRALGALWTQKLIDQAAHLKTVPPEPTPRKPA
jgi:hypothetical protein